MINGAYKNEVCEFCCKKKKWTSSNQFHGPYCEECLRISRKEDANCLRDIKEAREQEKL